MVWYFIYVFTLCMFCGACARIQAPEPSLHDNGTSIKSHVLFFGRFELCSFEWVTW